MCGSIPTNHFHFQYKSPSYTEKIKGIYFMFCEIPLNQMNLIWDRFNAKYYKEIGMTQEEGYLIAWKSCSIEWFYLLSPNKGLYHANLIIDVQTQKYLNNLKC